MVITCPPSFSTRARGDLFLRPMPSPLISLFYFSPYLMTLASRPSPDYLPIEDPVGCVVEIERGMPRRPLWLFKNSSISVPSLWAVNNRYIITPFCRCSLSHCFSVDIFGFDFSSLHPITRFKPGRWAPTIFLHLRTRLGFIGIFSRFLPLLICHRVELIHQIHRPLDVLSFFFHLYFCLFYRTRFVLAASCSDTVVG